MLSQALEANGALVYIIGRRQEVLEKAASTAVSDHREDTAATMVLTFLQKHGNIHVIKADVTSRTDLEAAAEHINQRSGYVNIVVANAGISGPTLGGLSKDASLIEFRDYLQGWDIGEYNRAYAINTTAVFSTIVAFLELLDKGNKAGNVEQKSQFVAVSSAGAFSRVPMAGFAYGGSKAATVHIMKQFATKMVPYGIRANVIAPGCKLFYAMRLVAKSCRRLAFIQKNEVAVLTIFSIPKRNDRRVDEESQRWHIFKGFHT